MFKFNWPQTVLCSCLLLQLGLGHSSALTTIGDDGQKNFRPIIGIVAQEWEGDESISYIAAPYVKQMEASGARVVPVLVRQSEEYYRQIVAQTNGLLLPGGGVNIMASEFGRASQLLFKYATAAYDRGEYYPIYGVCQGLQMATVLVLQQWAHHPNPYQLSECLSEDVSLNLKFLMDPKESTIFRDADTKLIKALEDGGETPNFHHLCMTPDTMNLTNLTKYLRLVSTSNDSNGIEFASTLESTNASRPIFLIQWHPEKSPYEFKNVGGEQEHLPHTKNAVLMSQYMGNFFVGEARKNLNKFESTEAETEASIFNCNPIFTMDTRLGVRFERDHFSQLYLFSGTNGCEPSFAPPLFNYYVIVTVALAWTVGILIGVLVAKVICKGKSSGYTPIGGNHG